MPSSSFPCSHPTSPSPIYPCTPDTCCFKGHPCHSTSGWVLPMIRCLSLRNLHTSRSLLPAPALPIPSHTFPPTVLSLSLSLLLHANFASIPSPLPIASPRGTFAPGGCFLCIYHISSSPPSLLAALLPSLATPLMGVTKVWLLIIGVCPFIRDKGDKHKSGICNLRDGSQLYANK